MEAYKTRMIIEYRELKERTDKLAEMLDRWDKGTLDFEPTCPKYLLEKQLEVMKDYPFCHCGAGMREGNNE